MPVICSVPRRRSGAGTLVGWDLLWGGGGVLLFSGRDRAVPTYNVRPDLAASNSVYGNHFWRIGGMRGVNGWKSLWRG